MEGFGRLVEYPDAAVIELSEEHGGVDLSACAAKPAIGERVRVIPNHARVVSNSFDTVALVSGEVEAETVPVAARGRVG